MSRKTLPSRVTVQYFITLGSPTSCVLTAYFQSQHVATRFYDIRFPNQSHSSRTAKLASSLTLETLYSRVLHSTNISSFFPPKVADHVLAFVGATPRSPGDQVSWLNIIHQAIQRIVDHLSTRSTVENTPIILAVCTFLVLLMSWTSRFGNLGRFSPFTRSPPQGPNKVSDADFSYITAEDLRNHQAEQNNHAESPVDYGPPRDTDVLLLKSKKKEYPVHFPAYSIAKGEVTIREVREHAARKTSSDPSRVKLLYKGKNLKDDSRTAKQEGLKDGAELMCAIAETTLSDSDDDAEDDEIAGLDDGDVDDDGEPRKRRNRGKKTKRRNKRGQNSGASTPQQASNLGLPPVQASRAPSPKPAAPVTPMEKLAALRTTLHSFLPDVKKFQSDPPADSAKRDFEHKRLSETILTQVLLKLDAVETEGDADARLKRKELVKETQNILQELDAARS
nr:bag family molecular chaperone regulator 1b [Quercus suber]